MTLSMLLTAALASAAASPPQLPKAVFELAAPLPAWQRTIVEEHVLYCENDRCVGPVEPILSSQIRACRLLNRRVGRVTGVIVDGEVWAADRLARCNGDR